MNVGECYWVLLSFIEVEYMLMSLSEYIAVQCISLHCIVVQFSAVQWQCNGLVDVVNTLWGVKWCLIGNFKLLFHYSVEVLKSLIITPKNCRIILLFLVLQCIVKISYVVYSWSFFIKCPDPWGNKSLWIQLVETE